MRTSLKLLMICFGLVLLVMFSRWLDSGKDNSARCNSFAESAYRENLTEALADPTVWQFAGNTSAQEYAKRQADLMRSICIKMP